MFVQHSQIWALNFRWPVWSQDFDSMILVGLSTLRYSMFLSCDKISTLMDEVRAVNVACLYFSKVFDNVSHHILINKLTVWIR